MVSVINNKAQIMNNQSNPIMTSKWSATKEKITISAENKNSSDNKLSAKKGVKIVKYEMKNEYLNEIKCQTAYKKMKKCKNKSSKASRIMYVIAKTMAWLLDLTTVQMI